MPKTRKTVKRLALEDKHPLTALAERACMIAEDAALNLVELIEDGSRMAFLAIRDCEKELDKAERDIDEQLPEAITGVGETRARELLATLRFITDLERIGDLILWVATRLHTSAHRPAEPDRRQIANMARILQGMLAKVRTGFSHRDVVMARQILEADSQMDQIRHSLFRLHLGRSKRKEFNQILDVILMAQALERAGDHATNLAEELYHLIEGHSVRHQPKRKTEN